MCVYCVKDLSNKNKYARFTIQNGSLDGFVECFIEYSDQVAQKPKEIYKHKYMGNGISLWFEIHFGVVFFCLVPQNGQNQAKKTQINNKKTERYILNRTIGFVVDAQRQIAVDGTF